MESKNIENIFLRNTLVQHFKVEKFKLAQAKAEAKEWV